MKALVVDDDRVLADLVAFALKREGFQVVQAHDGPTALAFWQAEQPDIIILDVNLPKAVPALDGFSVTRQIRLLSDVPIILLTVRADEDDIVFGLQAGADDYILKPFSPRQLVARVQTILRRTSKVPVASELQVEDLVLNPGRRQVVLPGGKNISLTALECRLLEYLMHNAGQVLPVYDLIDHVWGMDGGDRDMLRQLVKRLRSKIEVEPSHPVYIETVPGLGYGFRRSPGVGKQN